MLLDLLLQPCSVQLQLNRVGSLERRPRQGAGQLHCRAALQGKPLLHVLQLAGCLCALSLLPFKDALQVKALQDGEHDVQQ